MGSTISKDVQEGKEGLNDSKGLENSKLTAFSLYLNQLIKDYEKENNTNIMVCNIGYKVYPDKYINQEKLQLFDIIP